jgi:hypothetical protein
MTWLFILIAQVIGMWAMYRIGFDRGVSAVTASIDYHLQLKREAEDENIE